MSKLSSANKYDSAVVSGSDLRVVNPSHFYASESKFGGQGLFCEVDLVPGDIWWAHNFSDPRYVSRIIPWEEYLQLTGNERSEAERLCYVDPVRRALIICTEPFCRVNHGPGETANCDSDEMLNSLASKCIPAHTELLIPYDYEAVVSLLWKFPELKNRYTTQELKNESFLLSPAIDYPDIVGFLTELAPP